MEREISILLKIKGAAQAKRAIQRVFDGQTQTLVEGFNKGTKKTGDNMNRVSKTSKQASTSMSSLTKTLGRGMAALYLYNRAWNVFGRNFESGLQLQRASDQFNNNVEGLVKMLPELRAATQGVVADFDLLKTANRAFHQGIQPQQISKTFGMATAAAQKLGLSATDAINTITSAITKQDEGALNTLGIVTKVNQAYKTQAALIAKNGGVMSQAMSIQLRQSLIMKELEKRFGGLNAVQEDGLMSLERFRASWKNFRATLGQTTGIVLEPLTRALTGVLDVTTALLNKLNDTQGFQTFVKMASTLALVFGGMKFINGARSILGVLGLFGGSEGSKASKGLMKINIAMGKFGRVMSGIFPILGSLGSSLTRILGLSASFSRIIPGWGVAITAATVLFDPLVELLGKAWTAGKIFFQLLSSFDPNTGLSKVLKKDADELGNFYYVVESTAKLALQFRAVIEGVAAGVSDAFSPLGAVMDLAGRGINYVAHELFGLSRTGPVATSKLDQITERVKSLTKWIGLGASAIALFIPGLQGIGAAGVSVFGGSLINEAVQSFQSSNAQTDTNVDRPSTMESTIPRLGMASQDRSILTGMSMAPTIDRLETTEGTSPTPRAMNLEGKEDATEELRKMRKILEKQTGMMEIDSQKQDIRESQKNAGNNIWLRR